MGEKATAKHTPPADGSRFDEWNFACRICGSPYRSRPAICYDCGNETVVAIERVLADPE